MAFMKNHRHGLGSWLARGLLGWLCAWGAVGLAQTPPALSDGHGLAHEQARVKAQHLQRLFNRVNGDPLQLRQSCRYESEIATPPPPRRVVLTFDDGPRPGQTELILQVLQKHGIPGTFFLIGEQAKAHPELVQKILQAGMHTVGNHSWNHPNFHDIPPEQQAQEVLQYEEAANVGPVKYLFRYPYGNATCETNALLRSHGYRIVGWHVDSCDWAFDKDGSVDAHEALSCGVLAQNRHDFVGHVLSSVRAHNGGIVLMHEIHPHTLAQLDQVIVRLQQEGFEFASVEDHDFLADLR